MLDVKIKGAVGSFVLDVDFQAGIGVTALAGPSGAGKSSILRAIAGLWQPDEGHVRIGETVLFDPASGINLPTHKRKLGVVFQNALLFPHMNVARNLAYGCVEKNWTWDAVIGLLDLGGLLERRPFTLSGGEAQRVALGRALLSNPAMLLLDEPLTGLDDPRRDQVLPYLERIRDDTDVPIIYVSHHKDEIKRLADLVFVMDAGRVVAERTPNEYALERTGQ